MDHRDAMNTALGSRNQKERGCVRRGPAAAAPNPRRHPLESEASHAANLLRLVRRAHSRAPGQILAARENSEELYNREERWVGRVCPQRAVGRADTQPARSGQTRPTSVGGAGGG